LQIVGNSFILDLRMHSMNNNIKIVDTQQQRIINFYRNNKDKLLRTNIAI